MVDLVGVGAVILYLVPVLVCWLARARRERPLCEIALDVPLAVALDLLLTLLVARFVLLSNAVLIVRALWVVGGAVLVGRRFWRADRPEWPSALGRSEVLTGIVGAAGAAGMSLMFLRPCLVHDTRWHTPLVASMQGQSIPFHNVYELKEPLAYHYAGNAIGASIRTLSFDVLHTAAALGLAHTTMFALFGASLGLFLRWWGYRSTTFSVLSVFGVLLTGPLLVFRGDGAAAGYNFINLLRLSFRPHHALGLLLFFGFLCPVLVRLKEPALPLARTASVLCISTAALSLTDEASIGLLGLALGASWLVEPTVLHAKRLFGFGVLVLLLVAVLLPHALLPASFSPGATDHVVSIVGWRSPGYRNPILPLAQSAGLEMLLHDTGAMLVVTVAALVLGALLKGSQLRATTCFWTVLLFASIVALTRIDVDRLPRESHRFMTAAIVAAPLFAAAWLPMTRAYPWIGALLGLAVFLPATSSLQWLVDSGPDRCDRSSRFLQNPFDYYDIDCRRDFGALLGEPARPTYVEKTLFYAYSGCHPLFATARPPNTGWKVKTDTPSFGRSALVELHNSWLDKNQPLVVACLAKRKQADALCDYARSNSRCIRAGSEALRCEMTPDQRATLLKKVR